MNAVTPVSWKCGIRKTLVERASLIYSTNQLLSKELKLLEKVFTSVT